LPANEAAAVALNVAVVAPAATVTDAGMVSEALLLASATAEPPAGAVWLSVTVHEDTAPSPRLAGLQETPHGTIPTLVRSASATAAHGADPETDEQAMEVAAAAVLSHKSIST
jgi:hypothetical protein